MPDRDINIRVKVKDDGSVVLEQLGDKGERSLKKIDQGSQRAATSMTGLESAAGRLKPVLSTLAAGFGVWQVGQMVGSITRVTMEFQGMETALKAVAGSEELMRQEMEYLRGEAKRLGLDLMPLVRDYTKLAAAAKGSVLEGEETRRIFTSVAQAARVLNMSAADTSGVLRAINQMMSKGKVQAEELRGQLGERLPGAFQLAAKAMGKTDAELNKMLDRGELLAVDLLPKLAQELENVYGDSVEEAAENAAASFARLRNSVIELQNSIGESGLLDMLASTADIFRDAIDFWWMTGQKEPSKIEKVKDDIVGLTAELDTLYERRELAGSGLVTLPGRLKEINREIQRAETRLRRYRLLLAGLEEQEAPPDIPIISPDKTKKKHIGVVYGYETKKTMGPGRNEWLRQTAMVEKEAADLQKTLDSFTIDSRSELDWYLEGLEGAEDKTEETVDNMSTFWEQGMRDMQDFTKDFFLSAMKGDFEDLDQKFLDMTLNMVANWQAAQMQMALFGKDGGGGIVNSLAAAASSYFLNSSFQSLPSTPAGFGTTSVASIWHDGGIVGQPTTTRRVPSSLFFNAPRLHGGLAPDEFPAILQTGEEVRSRAQVRQDRENASQPLQVSVNVSIGPNVDGASVHQLLDRNPTAVVNPIVKALQAGNLGLRNTLRDVL